MSARVPLSPRRLAIGTTVPEVHGTGPVVSLVRDPHLSRWIRNELAYLGQAHEVVVSVHDLLTWAGSRAMPRLLVISLDELEADELCALRRVRDGGFTGTLVALSRGRLQTHLRNALSINVLLTPPFVQDLLSDLLNPRS